MPQELDKNHTAQEPRVSKLAVWSLVCGTFFFAPPPGLAAILLSREALGDIRDSQGRLVGLRLARLGLWLGISSLVIVCATFVLALPRLTRARESSRVVSCRSNLKQIGLSIWMYEADFTSDGHSQMPPGLATLVREGYLKDPSVLLCPTADAWRNPPVQTERGEAGLYIDFAYARLLDPDDAPEDTPIMWDKYVHTERRFWHWTGRSLDGVNVLKNGNSARWSSLADLKAVLDRNRGLYESIPPLPVVGGAPRGWDATEYSAAVVTAFYLALVLVASFRPVWLYRLLPDEPLFTDEVARESDDPAGHTPPTGAEGS